MKYLVIVAVLLAGCAQAHSAEELAQGERLGGQWKHRCITERARCEDALMIMRDGSILRVVSNEESDSFDLMTVQQQGVDEWAQDPASMAHFSRIVYPGDADHRDTSIEYVRRLQPRS